jgi:hypothetical protein
MDGAVPELLRLTGFLGSDAIELQFSHPYPYWEQTYISVDLMIALCCFWSQWLSSRTGAQAGWSAGRAIFCVSISWK